MTTFLERVNENERKVLEVLAEEWSSETNCYFFKGIAEQTKLDIKQVRRACRSLKKKGSGYCATRKGAALISPCDVCGDVNTFQYDHNGQTVRECEEHYKKSPKLNPVLL